MLTEQQVQAIYDLYPQVIRTAGEAAYDVNGVQVDYDLALVSDAANKASCKAKAKELIAATDWAVLPDVGLANVSDFTAYRATLRQLILNPVANPVWPTEPTPVWS